MIVNRRVQVSLKASTRFGEVREFASIDSTNRWVAVAAANGAQEGLVAVADYQSAGRGRLGRAWEAPAGASLMASILLRPDLAPSRLGLVTNAVALAAVDACWEIAGVRPGLKWPNDLMVGEAKLAGILAESAGGAGAGASGSSGSGKGAGSTGGAGPRAVVVGIGLNVTAAPPGAACLAGISSAANAGASIDRGELLGALLMGLEARYGHWEAVAEEYRAACVTVGRRVRVTRAAGDLVGVAREVDDDGRLVVVDDDGATHKVSVGDVVHVRPSQ